MKSFTKVRSKLSLILLTCCIVLSACGGNTASNTSAGTTGEESYKAGTYTGTAEGKNGDLTVEVTFSDKEITNIEVKQNAETDGLSDPAIEKIPASIMEGQSLAVDTISGATVTSNAIIDAVADCVQQAGGDVEKLRSKTIVKNGVNEEISTEVVVVGGGASGSAAALKASENGAKVVVVETTASPAGQGTMAGGMFATSSSLQIAAGETVDPMWYYNQFVDTGNYQVNGGLLTKVIQNSGETVDWLIDNGVKLTLAHPATGGYYEHIETHPASTLHGYTEGGVKGITALHNSIESKGGQVLYETTAKDIILDNGKVAGIIAEKADGGTLTIHADVVILATGGFGGNEEKVAETFGEGYGQSRVATNMGTGIELAKKAGGDADYDKAIMMHYGVSRGGTSWNTTLNSALLNPYLHVDVDGNRFMNEEFTFEPIKSSNVIKSLPQQTAYELFDSTLIETVKEKGFAGITDVFGGELATNPTKFIEVGHEIDTAARYEASITPEDLTEEINKLVEEGVIIKAESPEEMAEKLGMANLVDTINRYNELCAQGKDTDHFKDAKYLDNLEGTIYAVKITPSVFLGTLGGIEVNQNLQVIGEDGKAIKGLYAAGSEVSGVYSDSYVYLEGGTLGFAYGSGRIAGENAAAEVTNNK